MTPLRSYHDNSFAAGAVSIETEIPSVCLVLGETEAEKVATATKLRVSFCSFCDAHLWCQVSRTLL